MATSSAPGGFAVERVSAATHGRRIAFICDWCLPRFGGLELQLSDLARSLVTQGHCVEILTSTPGPAEVEGITVHRLDGLRFPWWGFTCSLRQFSELGARIRDNAYDVLHVQCGVVAPLAYGSARIAARSGIPTAFTFHSVYDYLQPALRLLAEAGGARRLPIAWSAVSTLVAREASRALRGARVDILPNGIDPSSWACPAHRRTPGELRLVFAGRLQVRKRPVALIAILEEAQRLAGAGMRISLDVVGDGPQRARLERLARGALGGRVRMHGRVTREEIRALFAQADAFVLPSERESFGIAALEARCAGLPVIALRDTGVADFIEHRRSGLLGRNDAELARAVADLACDEPLRSAIAQHNREAEPDYAWSGVVARVLGQYDRARELLAAPRPH